MVITNLIISLNAVKVNTDVVNIKKTKTFLVFVYTRKLSTVT